MCDSLKEVQKQTMCGCSCRKRHKIKPEKPAKRVRPEIDNDQTRKLRSAQPEEPSAHSVPSMQHTDGLDHDAMQASNSAAVIEEAEVDDDEEQEMDSQPQGMHLCCYSLGGIRLNILPYGSSSN